MRDISLHLMDIIQNSIRAGASRVDTDVVLGSDGKLVIRVTDDGCGMDEAMVKAVTNPFVTSRTTRKVGLGIPLLMQNAALSGGSVSVASVLGEGTTVTAVFDTASIDCLPLGDLAETFGALVMSNPDTPDFTLRCKSPSGGEMEFSTMEVRAALDGVPLNEPDVVAWIVSSIKEEITPLLGGITA